MSGGRRAASNLLADTLAPFHLTVGIVQEFAAFQGVCEGARHAGWG